MIYQAKQFSLKNGLKVTIKSPEVNDSLKLLDNIVSVSKSTNYLLSQPEDYDIYYQNIKLEEDYINSLKLKSSTQRLVWVCTYTQHVNVFIKKISLQFSPWSSV